MLIEVDASVASHARPAARPARAVGGVVALKGRRESVGLGEGVGQTGGRVGVRGRGVVDWVGQTMGGWVGYVPM